MIRWWRLALLTVATCCSSIAEKTVDVIEVFKSQVPSSLSHGTWGYVLNLQAIYKRRSKSSGLALTPAYLSRTLRHRRMSYLGLKTPRHDGLLPPDCYQDAHPCPSLQIKNSPSKLFCCGSSFARDVPVNTRVRNTWLIWLDAPSKNLTGCTPIANLVCPQWLALSQTRPVVNNVGCINHTSDDVFTPTQNFSINTRTRTSSVAKTCHS
jgi:hypothetical protein